MEAERAARDASAAWDQAHNAGDATALGDLYEVDAVSMPFDRPALEGRAAIEEDFRAFFAEYAAHHETTIVALEIADGWAIERGHYELVVTPRGDGEAESETGKHIVVRRWIDGAWRITWEIWNRDGPAG